jgi:nicotinate-nucleotide--dimethylbenzimidazole phosphoribosyltransferase
MHIPAIKPTHDASLATALTKEINNKTKPLHSLGILESVAYQIGLIQQTTSPGIEKPAIIIFAADHGIVAENISAYPQSVTWQMVENFLSGGAAINVFARQNGCFLQIVDAGVNHDFGKREGLIDRKVGYGTRNFVHEPAMAPEECAAAIGHGMELANSVEGNVIGFGEMGIGNTTSAAAIMHKLTGLPVAQCTGAGTGLDDEGIRHKAKVISRAVQVHSSAQAPLEILAVFGGFEIAMMVGAMLAAAQRRMTILVDGFIVTSALLIAARLQPALLDYCVFSHCSNEQGHRAMLDYLKARPLLQLELRLGEGTGAVLALPIVQAAVNFICDMATFQSAAVSGKLD